MGTAGKGQYLKDNKDNSIKSKKYEMRRQLLYTRKQLKKEEINE